MRSIYILHCLLCKTHLNLHICFSSLPVTLAFINEVMDRPSISPFNLWPLWTMFVTVYWLKTWATAAPYLNGDGWKLGRFYNGHSKVVVKTILPCGILAEERRPFSHEWKWNDFGGVPYHFGFVSLRHAMNSISKFRQMQSLSDSLFRPKCRYVEIVSSFYGECGIVIKF